MPKVQCASLSRLSLAILLLVFGCGKRERGSQPEATGVELAQSALSVALDLEDEPVDPFRDTNATAFVFAFVSIDCPISNRSAPELQRLKDRFFKRGAAFRLVYPNKLESSEQIRAHLK